MADYVLGVEITGDASGLERAAGQANQALGGIQRTAGQTGTGAAQSFAQRLGGGIKDVSRQLGDFGKNMTILTAPVMAFGTKGTQSFLEVDKTMQLTNKTMRNSTEEAALLQKAMEEAAANSVFGMTDAANASLNFARAGLDAEQAANALAPAMNLAAGEGGNLDTVSAGLTATINGFGDSFENSGHYADVFAAACNNSALDVNGLSSAMSVAAPIFAASGKTVEDAALYMGIMANSGIEASVAANSLKTGMARLAKPAKDASAAMDQYLGGWSAFNEDGTMKSSLQIQKELHDGFANLSEQEQMAAASAIFGKNQMAPWLALINTAPEDVNALSDSLTGCAGTTDEMAQAMMSGAGGSVEKLKSSLDVLGTKFGEIISTALLPMANGVQGLTDWFLGLDEGTQQVIGTLAMMLAIIGPLALAIGLAGGAVGNLITMFGTFSEAIAGIQIASVAPIMAIVAVVGILIAAFLTLWNTNEGFRTRVIEIWTEIQETFGIFITALTEKLAGWGITWESVTGVIQAVWEAFCAFLAPIFILAFETISNAFTLATEVILGLLSVFHGLFTGDWNEVWEGVKQIFSAAWDFVVALFDSVCEALGLDSEAIKQDISEKFTAVKEFLLGIWDKIKGDAEAAWNLLKDIILGPVLLLCDLVTGDFDQLKEDAAAIWDDIKENGGKLWEDFKELVVDTAQSLAEGIQEKVNEVPGIVEDGFQGAIDFITGLPGEAWNWGSDIMDSLADGIWSGISWVQDAAASVADTIRDFLHFSEPDKGPLSDFHTYMPDMMKGLADGMRNGLPTLRAGVELVANEMSGVIPGTGTAGRYGGDGDRTTNLGGVNIVVNGAPGQNADDIADAVMRRMMDLVVLEG